jgi:hypothetical protein
MKNNIKLFFTSLISNNAAIDAGRKKPWYAAIIMFFVSVVLAVIPSSVIELNKHGDKNFDSTTYLAREAVTQFAEELQKEDYANKMFVLKQDKTSTLVADETVSYDRLNEQTGLVDYKFRYSSNENAVSVVTALQEEKVSFFVFTPDTVYISIVDPNNHDTVKVQLTCINAYKKLGENDIKESYQIGENKTETLDKTWANWKTLIRNLYNQTRLRAAGTQLLILSAVNVGIIAIMGFMIWVLTRGKNNPYRIFTVWESYKIVFWAALSPAILTTGLGFLIKTFASTIFPLLLGVRVMWLSMKSLRPDGSGYAAE